MKKIIYKIIVTLNIYRLIYPLIFYLINKKYKDMITKDFLRLDENIYRSNAFNYMYHIMFNKAFRAIVSYRIRNINIIFSKIFDLLFFPKVDLEIAGNIDSGLRINHGQSSVIVLSKAGKNLTIYQNVTCGRNGNHLNTKDNTKGNCYPTIGENVTIYSGAVVCGGINIGDNVNIGANCVVTKDIPSNATVVGNPPIIVKLDKKRVKINLI